MEIINSKAVELPTLEQEQKNQSMAARGEAEENKEDQYGAWGISTPLPQSVVSITIVCFFGE